jgi:predicted SprT family Zn-dependent metalloprotease
MVTARTGIPNTIPDVPLPESNDYAVVSQWARKVLDSFGLGDWYFSFDGARRRLGCCNYRELRITLSRYFVSRNGVVEIRETMLHEVAHALVGGGHGHGPVWKAMARRVGCRPVRCGRADMPPGNVAATCGCCARVFRRHRRPRAGVRHWCRRCGPERGVLTWGSPS